MRRMIGFALLFGAFAAMPCGHAHDTWLSPLAPTAAEKHWTVALTTGHGFPTPEHAPAMSRVARAERIVAAGALPLLPLTARREAQGFRVLAGDDALVVAVVSLRARDLTLDEAKVTRFLANELGEWPLLRERHRRLGHWRERYTKNAKSVLRVAPGDSAANASTLPHGLSYELVPTSDPTRRRIDEPLQVCAFADGRPVRAPYVPLRIGLVQRDGSASWVLADEQGCASLHPTTINGYLLRSVLIRPHASGEVDWISHFATLTVGVPTTASNATNEDSSL